MCVDVTFIGEITSASSVGDLISAGFIVTRSDMPDDYDWSSNECLCNVDVEAILERSGRPYSSDVFGWRVERA